MGYELLKFIYNFLKTIISVKTIMFLRLSGGLYYRVSSNRIVRILAAVYCLAVCLYMTYIAVNIIAILSTALAIKAVAAITMYNFCVVISLCTESEYFQVYLNDMEAIDVLLGVRTDMDIPVSRFWFLVASMSQLSIGTPFYVHLAGLGLHLPFSNYAIAFFVFFGVLTNFTRIMMFELLWYRVRRFRQHLKNTLSQVSRSHDTEDARESIRKCMFIYKKILNTMKKSTKPMKCMILVTVVTSVPIIIAIIFDIILAERAGDLGLQLHELCMDVILPCVPAMLVALSRGEVKRMKLDIGKQMLTCEDEGVREVLDDCLSFLEHRPFRYSVCRLLVVDVDMAIGLLNLYVTYSLAMIQFAHFYN